MSQPIVGLLTVLALAELTGVALVGVFLVAVPAMREAVFVVVT
jgi:hypothetical protein